MTENIKIFIAQDPIHGVAVGMVREWATETGLFDPDWAVEHMVFKPSTGQVWVSPSLLASPIDDLIEVGQVSRTPQLLLKES